MNSLKIIQAEESTLKNRAERMCQLLALPDEITDYVLARIEKFKDTDGEEELLTETN